MKFNATRTMKLIDSFVLTQQQLSEATELLVLTQDETTKAIAEEILSQRNKIANDLEKQLKDLQSRLEGLEQREMSRGEY
jgi:bacterioferritin (cytochrome b1)